MHESHTQNGNILVSICLVTFNQPEAILAFLESAVPQLTNETEIVIWDDSPSRETEKEVKKFAHVKNIIYFRGVTDGLAGIDRAVIATLKNARGKFAWTFGDEILEAGAIQKVLSVIKKYPDLVFIFMNSRSSGYDSTAFNFTSDRFFRDANDVLETIGTELSFISATIFDRKKALEGAGSAEKYIGTSFVHSYFVLTAMSHDGLLYCVSHPFVVACSTKPDDFAFNFNKDVFKVYIIDLFQIFNSPDFKGCFSRASIRVALADMFGGIWRGVLVARARGITANLGSNSPKIRPIVRNFWSYPEILIAVPLLALPRSVDRLLYRFYKKLRNFMFK